MDQYVSRRFALSGTQALPAMYPYNTPVDNLGVDRAQPDRGVISFAHYDYLGLANDPRVKDPAKEVIDRFGVGAGASRLVGGEVSLHRVLERELADFIGVEDTLTNVSGYGTNVALLGHLMTKDDLIITDQAAHNSIMTGCQLSRATSKRFQHNDIDDLDQLLSKHRKDHNRVLVVVEGLYSMDGDIPDLPRLLEVCRRHDAWIMVDEAHSIGVLGPNGRGITEHYGLPPNAVDIIVGTLSKSFVTCGGFVAGSKPLMDWLRCTMPGFVYSVGLSPPLAAAAYAAIQIARTETDRLQTLREKSRFFLETAQRFGLNTGNAIGAAVVPVHFQNVNQAIFAAQTALDHGFFVPAIAQIAVPKDLPRLRFFITKDHAPADIERVLSVLHHVEVTSQRSPRSAADAKRSVDRSEYALHDQ
ncbi:MAG: aminotransferase class I/II-fold pyridoxal phosphate-dependent enzyme [Pseudomonadota bacterium]